MGALPLYKICSDLFENAGCLEYYKIFNDAGSILFNLHLVELSRYVSHSSYDININTYIGILKKILLFDFLAILEKRSMGIQ